jgi:hypothetical protein
LQTSLKSEVQPSSQRDAISVACYRSCETLRIAARIKETIEQRRDDRARAGRFVGLCSDEAAALGAASLMQQCGDCQNVWHAEDINNEFGELYEGAGTLYACNVRLCPSCMNARRRISRQRAREGMESVRLGKGERWFFVTLTAPTLPARQASLLETMGAIYDAWGAFTKHGAFDEKLDKAVDWNSISESSIKGVEFTLGDQRCELHRKVRKDKNLKECQQCPNCREWDAERDGYHVHIHLLAVAKWIDAGKLRRAWSKCLRRAWERRGINAGINTRDGLAVCHIRLVTDRKVGMSASAINTTRAVAEVAKYITKAESFLSIPPDQLIDVASVRRWARMFEVLGGCRKKSKTEDEDEGRKPDEDAERYLDTKNLSSAEDARRAQLKELLKGSRARSIPLRTRAVELFMLGRGEQFNEELTAHVADVRSYRRLMLSERFTLATFSTLSGGKWFGSAANPAQVFNATQLYTHREEFKTYSEENRAQIEARDVEAKKQWGSVIANADPLERRWMVASAEHDEWFNWVNGYRREDGRWIEELEVTNEQKAERAEQWRLHKTRQRA